MTFGVLCILPNIWQRTDERYPFAGIEMMGTDQEFYYASRIGQVLEGDWWIADPYYGTKQKNFVQPPLPEWFEGGLGLVFRLDTARTVLVVKLVFGALLFFVMTLFFTRFTQYRWWSLFAVTAFLCAGFFFSAPQDLFSVISNPNFGGEFLRFSRLTNPLFSSLLFFLALNAFLSWAQNGSRIGLIFAGILTGLSFYSYPYTWTYLGAIYAAICGVFLFRHDWKRLKEMLLMGLIILLIVLPYARHQYVISHDPAYPDVLIRYIVLHSREMVWGLWMFLLFLLPFLPRTKNIFQPWWLLFGIGVAAVISMNQQVVTNLTIVPQHYHWYYILPLGVISWLIYTGASIIEPVVLRVFHKYFLTSFCIVGIIVSIALGVRFQQLSYIQQRDVWGTAQKMAPVLNYLDHNVKPGVITFAWGFENELIPIYTSGDVVDASNAQMCLCTPERKLDNYYLKLWLSGLSYDDAKSEFSTTRRFEVASNFRGTYYRELFGSYEGIPDSDIDYVLAGYKKFLDLTTQQKLLKYKIQYLVFSQDVIASLPRLPELVRFGNVVHKDPQYVVWKVRQL